MCVSEWSHCVSVMRDQPPVRERERETGWSGSAETHAAMIPISSHVEWLQRLLLSYDWDSKDINKEQ